MKRIAAITVKKTANFGHVDFGELKKKEMVIVHQWKDTGVLESFYIKSDTNGAVLIFKDLSIEEVKSNMESLPFYEYLESIEYLDLTKQF